MSTLADLTDETVAEAIDGASQAIERVTAAVNDQMRLMVYARLNPTAAQLGHVEELTQQSIESFLAGLSTVTVRSVAGIRSFASTIVARRVADHIRNPAGTGRGKPPPRSLDSTVAGYTVAGPLWQFLSAGATGPLSAAVREDQFQRAMVELSRLRDEYRAVITMAFFDQLSTAQIAERLGVSRQAAAMALLRAVRALRERLSAAESHEGDADRGS